MAGKPFYCWECYHKGRIQINSVYNPLVLVARMFVTNPASLQLITTRGIRIWSLTQVRTQRTGLNYVERTIRGAAFVA